ncbi:MAG: AAA family ATPase [Gemmatimonadetes bacterium]|nr:AAA family ATPase [Gemmatimonadota bacterium]
MEINSLKLANIRAIEAAEFRFQAGFNLIVGANGVGKSTVLDALRICLSRILPLATDSRAKAMSFDISDIRNNFPFLDAELSMTIGCEKFRFTRRQWRDVFAADNAEYLKKLRRKIMESERLRDRARSLLRELEEPHGVSDSDTFAPSKSELKNTAYAASVAPNCVFFSTNRSVVSNSKVTKSRTAGGKSAAYAEALVSRPMHIAHFANWMRVQETLAEEQNEAKRHLQVLRSAVTRFLPNYESLRPDDEKSTRLMIKQGENELDVGQLSEGERGVLTLVLDLARRLSQANPSLDDPLREGHAIILIDEIDLHLHPKWQRQIVHKLTETFPLCQFIATTHSPQVIGEVPHECIQIIAEDGEVYSPTYSFGVDSSRVLEEIMDADPRTSEVRELLSRLSQVIGKEQFNQALGLIDQLAVRLGDDDPEVTRLRTLLEFMEGE